MDMKFFEHFDELLPLLSSRLPKQQGTLNEGPLAAMVTIYGDYGLSVAYAALFAPKIELTQNCPVAFFGPDDSLPVDVFHVDLLHHQDAANRTPEFYRALGEALASFWTRQLSTSGIKGRFVYDDSTGYDVVYECDERGS